MSSVIKKCKKLGVDINVTTGKHKQTALNASIRRGDRAVARLLIKEGADINKKGGLWQRTPLMTAACWFYGGIAEHLLEKGASLDSKDSKGRSVKDYLAKANMGHLIVEAQKKEKAQEEIKKQEEEKNGKRIYTNPKNKRKSTKILKEVLLQKGSKSQ